jgi:ADP-ribose pyrophosphatase
MAEEILKSEYLYRGKILNVRLDEVRLTDDRKPRVVAREIVEHRGAVAIVALDTQARVLLVQQYRSAAQRELLEIPAGTLEVGEDPALCAVRELKEETGYSAANWENIGMMYSSPGFCTEKMYLFLAHNLTASATSPEDDESLQVELVPFSEAVAKIERGEIIDAKSIVGLMRAWKKLNPQ